MVGKSSTSLSGWGEGGERLLLSSSRYVIPYGKWHSVVRSCVLQPFTTFYFFFDFTRQESAWNDMGYPRWWILLVVDLWSPNMTERCGQLMAGNIIKWHKYIKY